jgi:hypothetical protein
MESVGRIAKADAPLLVAEFLRVPLFNHEGTSPRLVPVRRRLALPGCQTIFPGFRIAMQMHDCHD